MYHTCNICCLLPGGELRDLSGQRLQQPRRPRHQPCSTGIQDCLICSVAYAYSCVRLDSALAVVAAWQPFADGHLHSVSSAYELISSPGQLPSAPLP